MSSAAVTVADLAVGGLVAATASGPLNSGMGATVRVVEPSRFAGPGRFLRATCSHGYTFNLPADQQVTVRR